MSRYYQYLFISLLITAAFLSGCSHSFRLSRKEMTKSTSWPFYHGSVAAEGAIADGRFNGKLDIVWEKKVSGKPAGPMTLYHRTLVYPSTKRKIRFFDTMTGKDLGRIKTKGPAQTGLVIYDNLAFFAVPPIKRNLYCLNLKNGKQLWKRHIKDTPGGSIIVDNRLLVGLTTGLLSAYDPVTGDIEWSFSAEERFIAPATFGAGKIFQPGDKGTLFALSPVDGTKLFEVTLDGPVVNAVVVADVVIAATMTGHLYGVDPSEGRIVWDVTFGSPIWTTPAVADQNVFVALSDGEVVALNIADGVILWQFKTEEVIGASPIVIGHVALVGTKGGTIFSLTADEGKLIDKRQLEAAVSTAPVSDGDHVFVATESGTIICFGENNEQ